MSFKILLVDDEQNVLNGYRRTLQHYFLVDCATSGRQALELIRTSGPFAVVVSDYVMPEMNGIEFLTETRKVAPASVRIMLTGYPDLEVAIGAVNSGNIFYFLVKPCSPEQLVYRVIQGVEKYRAELKLWESPSPGGGVYAGALSTEYISANELSDGKKDMLKGKAFQYRGLHLWASGNLVTARDYLSKARDLFQQVNMPHEQVRSNYFLAALLLQEYRDRGKRGKLQKKEIITLLKEGFTLTREHGLSVDLSQEKEHLVPLLQWALTQDISIAKDHFKDLFRDMEDKYAPSLYEYQIFTLGPLQVYRDNKLLDKQAWRNPKVEGLFRYLLANRQIKKEKDKVMDTFWPDKDLKAAANNLSSTLYYLRQVLSREMIRFEKGFCWLDSGRARVDADVFEEKIKMARNCRDSRENEKALALYEEAFELYKGDFLEEHDYDGWILDERERLQDLYLQALEEAATLMAGDEKYEEATAVLEQGFRRNPCRLSLLKRLLQYLLLLGRKEDALACYRYSKEQYAEEYGLELNPDLAQMLE